jgi:hypothetical protein
MNNIIDRYQAIWGDNPLQLLDKYSYQVELTKKLDSLNPADLDIEMLYEIVLWKLNRFPRIDSALLGELRKVADIAPKSHRQSQAVLRRLLQTPGIALPMASTILRFLNPGAFQIIDDRVYRIVCPGKAKYPAKPQNASERFLVSSETIYFDYLDMLHQLASDKLPFAHADRVLYELDIALGNKIGDVSGPQ